MAYGIDYDSYDAFSVYFNILKIKYQQIDEIVSRKNFIYMNDKVNVFINLETIFRYITSIKGLEEKIYLKSDFNELIISNIINLAAHYKKFFANNNCLTNVFLYFTDFDSFKFPEYSINDEYRSFYINKYTDNPKYMKFTESLRKDIFPTVEDIFRSVPGAYIIKGTNIEGSLIPYIITCDDRYKDFKNVVISSDLYETQYSFIDNYINCSIVRNKEKGVSWITDIEDIITKLCSNQKDYDINDIVRVFNNQNPYTLLVCVARDKYRSMYGVEGLGPISLYKKLRYLDKPNQDIEELVKSFLGEDLRKNITNCFEAISIIRGYRRLTNWDRKTVLSQIVDNFDNNKLDYLNKNRFYNHRLMIEALTAGCAHEHN